MGKPCKTKIDKTKARGYNPDIRNPRTTEAEPGDPETLLGELSPAGAEVATLRERLKKTLAETLLR